MLKFAIVKNVERKEGSKGMTIKVFILTPFIHKILKGKGLIKKCRGCSYAFKIGDVVVSVGGTTTRWYCRHCAVKFKFI
jgi:hypothetical protein